MKIGILGGTGRMGTGLGKILARAGHSLFLGSRDPQRGRQTAEEIAKQMGLSQITGGTNQEAAEYGEIVIVAVPFASAGFLLEQMKGTLRGKIVIDITNPFGQIPCTTSAGEEHQKILGPETPVVAAWKTNFWTTLEHPTEGHIVRDVFLCGDNEKAKKVVEDLIRATGFRPIDTGGLETCRTLDAMVPLMIQLDRARGTNFTASWKLLP